MRAFGPSAADPTESSERVGVLSGLLSVIRIPPCCKGFFNSRYIVLMCAQLWKSLPAFNLPDIFARKVWNEYDAHAFIPSGLKNPRYVGLINSSASLE
jgi:hypothetical protein